MNIAAPVPEKATILVVDDTPDNLTLMNRLLERDYQVKVAINGEKALRIAASGTPSGDGMMIFFNDPMEIADPAAKALHMAIDMQARYRDLQTLWRPRGYTLGMGIGIAQGVATIGAIGFEGRRDYGAIGSVTNLAARLCGEAKGGQILVCDVVAGRGAGSADLRSVGMLALKGFANPLEVFEAERIGHG